MSTAHFAVLSALVASATAFANGNPPQPTPAESTESAADLFAAPTPTSAEPTPAAEAAPPSFFLKAHGSHEFVFHQPAYDDLKDYRGEMKVPAFRNVFGLEARISSLKLVSDWQFDLLLNSTASAFDNVTPRLRPLENSLSWTPAGANLKVTAGYQFFAWGVADQLNPTDNLNPRDYTQGLVNTPKIPVLAASVVWYPVEALSIEAVYVPVEEQSRFPVDLATMTQANLGAYSEVTYRDLKLGSQSLVVGGRVAYRGPVDASVSYLYDHDTLYVAAVSGALYPVPNAQVSLTRPRLHRVGADLKGTAGPFGLWVESAASVPDQATTDTITQRHWWVDYVAGLDVSFGPSDKGYLNLQYTGTVVPDFSTSGFDAAQASNPSYGEDFYRRALVNSLGFQTARMWQGASLDLKAELFDGVFTPELRAVYLVPIGYDSSSLTHYGSLVLNPELDFMPVDSFHIKVGAHLAWSWVRNKGSSDVSLDFNDRIGMYTQFNNVYIKLAYRWDFESKK